MDLFWGYVRKRNATIKKPFQKNFTRPMLAFPSFPKELLSDTDKDDDELGVDEAEPTPTHPAIEEKAIKGLEGDEVKTQSLSIETDQDE
ncbi:hypothetical protein J1N35_043864 [Gossypium stocksii]|uniref:Uncharacterized protein n=1 Tax=Gossypium stocksii TaxID=47602 RepID=A0A9D3U8D9_9ROSI|nr:hypothetical protein J1N35_043864 [Gossypium stocksii]